MMQSLRSPTYASDHAAATRVRHGSSELWNNRNVVRRCAGADRGLQTRSSSDVHSRQKYGVLHAEELDGGGGGV